MENKIYKPLFGKMFYAIWIPTAVFLLAMTVVSAKYISALIIMLATDIFTLYFLLSSVYAWVELRENSVFIRFGFIKTVEIPYERIRGVSKERKFYADSMMSIKNSMEHVNIKYNRFDVASVSVVDNDAFISDLELRMQAKRA